MPFFNGDDYFVFIESATPGTFNKIKGQRELSHSFAMGTYSQSTKDSPVELSGAAGVTHGVTFAFMPELPDSNGATRFKTLANTRASVRAQIRNAADVVVFDCVMRITGFNTDYPFRDGVGVQSTLVPAAAPTVDLLLTT
ncbi:hypothetical protein [Sandarakinorhabdus sp.]|uniref:hypothetical protein n=1 Tax=Sandarakinorhabdus sp. TaxID=1916663 RepID=UPI00286DD7FF|nr:hypothetical protein [Sandarakinorhabdus sp.]